MADTSVVFSILGRENVGGPLARVRSLFRSTGQEAERATRQAGTSTARLDGQIRDVERSLALLNAEFAATGNKELFVKMKRDRSLLSQLRAVRREVGSANDDLRRNDGSGFARMLDSVGSAAANAASNLGSSLGSSLMSIGSSLWGLIPAALGVAAAIGALAPAAIGAVGALAALPGVLAGVAGAFATLKLGTMGLTEQWKAQTTASGGAAKAARDMTSQHRAVEQAAKQVTRAERDVKDAVKEVTKAERDVTAAQKEAAAATLAVAAAVEEERKRRRDLAVDVASASLDVQDATEQVTQAEQELATARANGADQTQIDDLDRAYQRSLLTLQTAKNRVTDLGEEQGKAAKTGVAGSDLVVAAKDREKAAIQRVKDAQDAQALAVRRVGDAQQAQADAVQRLADAQKALAQPQAGGGGGGVVPPKIAASAQKFLDVLKQLRPAFKDLQLSVQERLFAGLGDQLRTMATAWLPQLRTSLGGMADMMNDVIGRFMTTASQPTFIKNIGAGLDAFTTALGDIGRVAAGPLTTAFGNLSKASAPFVRALGGQVAKVLGGFSDKVNKLAAGGKNSKLSQFFTRATDVMKDTFRLLKSLGSIVGSVFGAFFNANKDPSKDPFKGLANSAEDLAKWFKNPDNIKKVQDFFTQLREYGGQVLTFIRTVAPIFGTAMSLVNASVNTSATLVNGVTATVRNFGHIIGWVATNAPLWWGAVRDAFGAAKDWIVTKATALVGWFQGLPGRIGRATSGMYDSVKTRFASARDWVKGRANDFVTWIGKLPGRISSRAARMFDGIKNAFRGALNWVISRWNGFSLTMGGGSIAGITFPSMSLNTPDIPYLAKGGIVPARAGGTLAVLGEGGRDEAVVPLGRDGGLSTQPMQIMVAPAPNAPLYLQALVRAILPHLQYEVRTQGGGSAQKLLGARS